jgi:hypothetical protein
MWEDLKEGIKDLLTFGGRSARETRRINEQQLRMSVYALKISVYTLIFAVVVSINSSEKPQSEPFVVQARSEPYADSFLPFSPVGLNLG